MQEIQVEKQINMPQQKGGFILFIIVKSNNYNSWSYIGSYKEDFLIITDVGLKKHTK